MGKVKKAKKAYLAIKMLSFMRKKSRIQTRELFQDKSSGFFQSSFEVLHNRDEEMFFKSIRMDPKMFDMLLKLLEPCLTKCSIRTPVKPAQRLFLTLVYLAHGSAYHILSACFKLGHTTVRNVVLETCEKMWELLGPIYLAVPHQDEWKRIAKEFENKWNLPNCVGAIDGKHINIVAPPNSGSLYFNYKGHHSVVLLAICDANYIFTAIDVGAFGSQSDGGIFARSNLGKEITGNKMNLPPPAKLPNTDLLFPHFFVGDAAFPLLHNLMKPFPGKNLNAEKTATNYRISKARITIENAFGILTARWRVLRTTLHMYPKNAEKIVLACVTMHNFLKLHKCSVYCDNMENMNDTENEITPLSGIVIGHSNRASSSAINNRIMLSQYLLNN